MSDNHNVVIHFDEESRLWTGRCIRCTWYEVDTEIAELGTRATDHELIELLKGTRIR